MLRKGLILAAFLFLGARAQAQSTFYTVYGAPNHLYAGRPLASLGDLDNDGIKDFAVGWPGATFNGVASGAVHAVSGGTGNTIWLAFGYQPGDQFGYSIAPIGDVNGDGVDDVIVGAIQLQGNGYAEVRSGADGTALRLAYGLTQYGQFGASVAAIGDFNADTIPDFAVGSPSSDFFGPDSGMVSLHSGADGSSMQFYYGFGSFDYFGSSLSSAGDFDFDGKLDFLVGAPEITGQPGYVMAFASSGTGFFMTNPFSTGRFGHCVAGGGDVNRDGYPDFLIGAPTLQSDGFTGNNAKGSAWLYSGFDGTLIQSYDGEIAGDRFGWSLAHLGDVDNDGYGDFIGGAFSNDHNGFQAGSARVYSGKAGVALYDIYGDSANDRFGEAVCALGDVDADGIPDAAVGAPNDSTVAVNAGAARVVSLRPLGLTFYGTGTSGCSGLQRMSASGPVKVGGSFFVTCSNTPPNSFSLGVFGDVPHVPGFDYFGLGILIHIEIGASTFFDGFDMISDSLGYAASAATTVPPGIPAGSRFYFQAISLWNGGPCAPSWTLLSSSAGVEIEIQP